MSLITCTLHWFLLITTTLTSPPPNTHTLPSHFISDIKSLNLLLDADFNIKVRFLSFYRSVCHLSISVSILSFLSSLSKIYLISLFALCISACSLTHALLFCGGVCRCVISASPASEPPRTRTLSGTYAGLWRIVRQKFTTACCSVQREIFIHLVSVCVSESEVRSAWVTEQVSDWVSDECIESERNKAFGVSGSVGEWVSVWVVWPGNLRRLVVQSKGRYIHSVSVCVSGQVRATEWVKRVKTDTLDITPHRNCILGTSDKGGDERVPQTLRRVRPHTIWLSGIVTTHTLYVSASFFISRSLSLSTSHLSLSFSCLSQRRLCCSL